MNAANLPVNWFDLVAVGLLTAGFIMGRKRGMSGEIPSLIQMVLMVFVAGMFYKPLSQFMQHLTRFPRIVTHPSSYIVILAGIRGVFAIIKEKIGEKLSGRNLFGRLEFSLGALSGTVRWACGLVIVLSLLSTKLVTDEQNKARVAAMNKELGSDYFGVFDVGFQQQSIFKESFVGSQIKERLSSYLIEGSRMGDNPPANIHRPPDS